MNPARRHIAISVKSAVLKAKLPAISENTSIENAMYIPPETAPQQERGC